MAPVTRTRQGLPSVPPVRAGGRRPPRLTAALAALALLWHLVFPVYALAAAGAPADSGLVPICTSKGIVWVQLDPDAPDPPQDLPAEWPAGQSFAQPCHFCATHASPLALPLAAGAVIKMWLGIDAGYPSYSVIARSELTEGLHAIRAPPA